MAALDIRTAGARDIEMMRAWAVEEGWDQGLQDRHAFAAADPRGFLVGSVDGKPVACIAAIRYGDGHGFIGYFIARPEERGKGYGLTLFRAAMDRLAGRLVGLDGVPAQQDNYRRSGFHTAWENCRLVGHMSRVEFPDDGTETVDAGTVAFDELADYDRRFFPAPRDAFLSAWTSLPGHTALAVLRGGRVAGFGVIRPSTGPWRVGPLYADSPALAAALLAELATAAEGSVVSLDVPGPQTEFIALLKSAGLTMAGSNARMYTGAPPAIDQDGLFGITSGELG